MQSLEKRLYSGGVVLSLRDNNRKDIRTGPVLQTGVCLYPVNDLPGDFLQIQIRYRCSFWVFANAWNCTFLRGFRAHCEQQAFPRSARGEGEVAALAPRSTHLWQEEWELWSSTVVAAMQFSGGAGLWCGSHDAAWDAHVPCQSPGIRS